MSVIEILSVITFLIFLIFCLIIIKILSGQSRYLRENYQKINFDKFNSITFQQKW